jgi:hypothetical protein
MGLLNDLLFGLFGNSLLYIYIAISNGSYQTNNNLSCFSKNKLLKLNTNLFYLGVPT